MIYAEVDTSKLERVIDDFVIHSGKEMSEVVKQQAGQMVGHLIALTPPSKTRGVSLSKTGGITNAAKKIGEKAIRADIASLFPTTRMNREKVERMIENGYRWGTGRGAKQIPRYAGSVSELRRIHKESRSPSTGRVRVGSTGQRMAITTAALRREFAKEQIKTVGKLNAGWVRAAEELKTAKRAVPVWIRRHKGMPGSVQYLRKKNGLGIIVSNRMDYMPRDIRRRYQTAIDIRTRMLTKNLKLLMERNTKKANRKLK